VKKVNWTVVGLIGLAGVVIALDQSSKALLRSRLAMGEVWSPGGWLGNIIQIVRTQNTGAAFSMGSGLNPVFTALAIAASLAILVYALRLSPQDRFLAVGLGLLLGGIVGNLIDRLLQGHVTDFISVSYFAILNIADISISLGGATMILALLRKEQQEKKESDKQALP
jgi:signal peptidase II